MKFIFFKIISLVLLFCKILGQTATTLRQKFQSFDRLGYIENGGLNVNFNPYPQQVYQIMTQHPNGTVNVLMWIDNENKTNWAQHCSPQIVLPKMNRRVGFRNTHKIKISTLYNKAQPIHQKLFHLFQISIDLSDHQMSSQNGRIVLMIMKQGHTLNGTIVNINGVSLMQSNTSNTAFFLTDIKNLSFQGVIDLDSIVDYAIKNSLISQSNVIRQVRLVSQNTQGVFSLSISYCMIFDFLVYLKNGSNGTIAELGWYLEINHTNFNQSEYLQIQTIQTPIKLSDIKFVCNILPTSTTYKGSFQIRVGYYKSWVTPFEAYRFPLDPKQTSTNFIAQTVFTYSNQPTNKVSICWILRARSDFNNISQQFNNQTISAEKEIHICPFISSSLELPAIQEFIVSDTLNNKYLFRYSQISGTPSVFTFWTTSGTITGGLDLFQFLTRLVNTNKFGPNDLISGLSFAFKVYSYSGNFVVHRINLLCGSNEYLVSSSPQICRACALSMNGCLHCLNSSYCLTCLNKDWLLQNGVCKCSDGFMQSESGISAKCLPAIKFNTSLSCLLMDEGQTFETCINSPSVKTSTILTFVSVPNMALFIRVSQIYTFIDDFTYYVYHNMSYGVKFDLFVKFMWNLTNERFIPHSIAKFYYNIQDQYDKQIDAKTLTYVPEGWADLGQGATFLSNTRDCWLCLFPLNILIFLFFNSIYRVLAHFQSRFAVKLTAFKWVSIFVFSLFSQNIQFISFRSFQHILYAGPPSCQPSIFVYIANYFTCYFFLFFFVIFACFGIGVLRYILQANILYGLDFAKYSLQTLWFYGIINFFRMFIGFTHAWFYQDNYAQFILLSLSQITVLIAIICFRDIFKLKSFLTFMMNEYIFRAALHCYLFITVQLKASGESLSENVANEFDETALFLVIVIMLFSFLESFSLMLFSLQLKISSDYINKKSNKQVKQKSFKLNKLSILHKKISERKSQAENGILQSCNPPVFKDTTQRLQKKQVEVFKQNNIYKNQQFKLKNPQPSKRKHLILSKIGLCTQAQGKKGISTKKSNPKHDLLSFHHFSFKFPFVKRYSIMLTYQIICSLLNPNRSFIQFLYYSLMEPQQKQQKCQNCLKPFPSSKIGTHFSYCRRNIRRCTQCPELIDINYQQQHMAQFHTRTPCKYCSKPLSKNQLHTHQSNCLQKTRKCDYCDNQVKKVEYDKHVTDCGSRTRQCGLCEKNVTLREFEFHVAVCEGKVQDGGGRDAAEWRGPGGKAGLYTKPVIFPEGSQWTKSGQTGGSVLPNTSKQPQQAQSTHQKSTYQQPVPSRLQPPPNSDYTSQLTPTPKPAASSIPHLPPSSLPYQASQIHASQLPSGGISKPTISYNPKSGIKEDLGAQDFDQDEQMQKAIMDNIKMQYGSSATFGGRQKDKHEQKPMEKFQSKLPQQQQLYTAQQINSQYQQPKSQLPQQQPQSKLPQEKSQVPMQSSQTQFKSQAQQQHQQLQQQPQIQPQLPSQIQQQKSQTQFQSQMPQQSQIPQKSQIQSHIPQPKPYTPSHLQVPSHLQPPNPSNIQPQQPNPSQLYSPSAYPSIQYPASNIQYPHPNTNNPQSYPSTQNVPSKLSSHLPTPTGPPQGPSKIQPPSSYINPNFQSIGTGSQSKAPNPSSVKPIAGPTGTASAHKNHLPNPYAEFGEDLLNQSFYGDLQYQEQIEASIKKEPEKHHHQKQHYHY